VIVVERTVETYCSRGHRFEDETSLRYYYYNDSSNIKHASCQAIMPNDGSRDWCQKVAKRPRQHVDGFCVVMQKGRRCLRPTFFP